MKASKFRDKRASGINKQYNAILFNKEAGYYLCLHFREKDYSVILLPGIIPMEARIPGWAQL